MFHLCKICLHNLQSPVLGKCRLIIKFTFEFIQIPAKISDVCLSRVKFSCCPFFVAFAVQKLFWTWAVCFRSLEKLIIFEGKSLAFYLRYFFWVILWFWFLFSLRKRFISLLWFMFGQRELLVLILFFNGSYSKIVFVLLTM